MFIRQRILVFFCFLLLIAGVMPQKDRAQGMKPPPGYFKPATVLPVSDKRQIWQDHFVLVRTVEAIPPLVSLPLLGKHPHQEMADAGKPFQATDVVMGPPLPFRRLVFAAISARYCLVYYEYGGITQGTVVRVYRLSPRKAACLWAVPLVWKKGADFSYCSLAELQQQIVNGRFEKYANLH